jgi:hypothetical protein
MSLQTAEKAVRTMRQKIFDYADDKEEQASRILSYLKVRMFRERNKAKTQAVTGQWSGLTRSELARTGTCETDWY